MWWFSVLVALVAGLPMPAVIKDSCNECKATFLILKDLSESNSGANWAYTVSDELCRLAMVQDDTVCSGISTEFAPVFLQSLAKHYFDPEFACFKLGHCSSPIFVAENLTEWMAEVLASKPKEVELGDSDSKTMKFAHITDLHIDMEYLVGSEENCNEPLCCRSGTGNAGKWGSYKCDLPVNTLDVAIESLSEHSDLELIIWTGDSPPHNIWNQSQAYQISYIKKATEIIRKHFPNTPIYPVLGNHGCYPVNIFGFGEEAWLTDTLAELWGPFLPAGAADSLKTIGSYSVIHPGSKLRVISLNTQACYSFNFKLLANVTDPGNLIQWLHGELEAAEKNGERVFIAGHVSPGFGDCLDDWSWHYNALVERYAGVIKGQFFGHTHWDHFFINRGVFSGEPVAVEWVAPSLTTYLGINPSYRIFEAGATTYDIINIFQYRMDVNKAKKSPDATPTWDLAYDFKSAYGVKNLKPDTIAALAEQIAHGEKMALSFLYNKYTGGASSLGQCDSVCRQQEFCQVNYGVNKLVRDCQKSMKNLPLQVINALYGPWIYRK